MIWATKGYDSCILGDKRFINTKQVEQICNARHVKASCVVFTKEMVCVGNAQIVVKQARKKGISVCAA